jgi:hypothetical protein
LRLATKWQFLASLFIFFVANVWRNPTSQFLFSLAKVAKAAAVVANDCGVQNVGKSGENLAKPVV